jgi:hypothetical protein
MSRLPAERRVNHSGLLTKARLDWAAIWELIITDWLRASSAQINSSI